MYTIKNTGYVFMAFTIKTNISGLSIDGRESGPLSTLYNSQQVSIERFPETLFSETKKHAVVFYIKEVIKQNSQYAQDFGNSLGAAGEAIKKVDEISVSSIGRAAGSVANQLPSAGISVFNVLGRIDYQTKTSKAIALYIPDSVQFNYNRAYNSADMTATFGKAYELAQVGAALTDRYKGPNALDKFRDNALNDPNVRRIFGQAINRDPNVLTQAAGFALNPQTQVLFQGLDFRTFQFNFLLTPKSKKEAEQIQNIVKLFKLHSAPEIENFVNGSPGMFFKVPDRFGIQFQIYGSKNEAIPTIGECVLKDVSVDYSPNGWSAYTDGNPAQVQLSLTFQEVEIVDRKKIKEQNY